MAADDAMEHGDRVADAAIALKTTVRTSIRTVLSYAIFGLVALHAILLLIPLPHAIAISRLCTASVPIMAAVCFLWRAQLLALRERVPWRWLSLAVLLWAGGQIVETFVSQSTSASNLAIDPSDFLYITAAFPLLLAISTTRETESIRLVFFLDCAQVLLAFVLTYFRLYEMALPTAAAATEMGRIYGVECSLLAIFVVFRLVTWSTYEERRRIRLLTGVVWIYLPIELWMDYATKRWNLQGGTLLDILWSVPFLFSGWQALHLPTDEPLAGLRKLRRGSLLMESLYPALLTVGVFALAASIMGQHRLLSLAAIFLLLLVQCLHAGVMQTNYLIGQNRLLQQGEALRDANAALERLSMEDPLTGIANRRGFDGALETAWKRAVRSRESVAILMIDVDFFKGVNDMHGHSYGDACLIQLADILGQQAGRVNDMLARYGGEEFIFLLPDTEESGALVVAERLQHAVDRLEIPNEASPYNQMLTLSIGVGVCRPKVGLSAAVLVDIADKALYEAKRLGRNRICSRAL
jgi:diguanylate cyclase (GGDEF)-like protein